MNGHVAPKTPYRNTYTDFKSLDVNDNQAFERRYKSPCKDKEQHLKYPDNRDMVQTTASLKREERLLQARQDFKKSRTDKVSGCRAKTSKTNEPNEAWKTPLLNRNFRYSDRFVREETQQPSLRREKTFDNTLPSEKESESPRTAHEGRMKAIGLQLKENSFSPLAASCRPLRKSLPSLLIKDNEEKDEFQAELKKATSRIRNELGPKINISENKTSQNEKMSAQKPNPTKTAQSKVKESSLKSKNVSNKQDAKMPSRISRPLNRNGETKQKAVPQSNVNAKSNAAVSRYKFNGKENGRLPDRGQASGKESTPEHSPARKKEPPTHQNSQEK